tara:strand:- start:354 stop:1178 length:825 start_codon:yes stop_codon:yes gene_type:complete
MKLEINELRSEGENQKVIFSWVNLKSNKYQIFIPSKNRAENCITAQELILEGADFVIVVEPQDYAAYKKVYSENNLLVLNENDKGIGYVRNFIKNYAANKNLKYYWQIDDDLKFKKRINDKNEYHSACSMLSEIESYVDGHSNIGIAGLRNQVFAWTLKTDMTFNIQCCAANLVRSDMKAQYENEIVEDTDFNMQVLTEGFCTVTFDKLLFMTGTPGKNSGGCSGDTYYNKITQYQENFIKKWGKGFVINETKDGTKLKGKGIWKTFKQKPLKK